MWDSLAMVCWHSWWFWIYEFRLCGNRIILLAIFFTDFYTVLFVLWSHCLFSLHFWSTRASITSGTLAYSLRYGASITTNWILSADFLIQVSSLSKFFLHLFKGRTFDKLLLLLIPLLNILGCFLEFTNKMFLASSQSYIQDFDLVLDIVLLVYS